MKNRRLRTICGAALMNAMTVGIASTYSSTATENMKKGKLNPNDEEVSWIGSILPLGAIIGGIVAGYLADKIGRKGVMMVLSLPLVTGWLLIAYAPSLPFVYIGRFITGICCGLICVVTPMYVVEISIPEIRGNSGSGFQVFVCLGIVICSLTGKFLPWEWLAITGATVAIVALLCTLILPESPRWLLMHNKQADAVRAVDFLYGRTNDAAVNQLVSESLGTESSSTVTLSEISQPTFYKPAVLSIVLMFLQQFSGSNAILYYTVSIFKQASTSLDPTIGNVLVAYLMCTFTLITAYTIDIIGRKTSLFISGLFTCLSLNVMSVYLLMSSSDPTLKHTFGWIPLACLLVYISAFSMGLGPVPWLMMSEMSPARGRSLICGLGTALSWTFAFVITKSFLQIESVVGDFGAYWIYSGFCLFTCFFAFFFLPETKGKTMEEIQNYFAGGAPQLQSLSEVTDDNSLVITNDDQY